MVGFIHQLVQLRFAIHAACPFSRLAEARFHKQRKSGRLPPGARVRARGGESLGAAKFYKGALVLAYDERFRRRSHDTNVALCKLCAGGGKDRQFFIARGNDEPDLFPLAKLEKLWKKIRVRTREHDKVAVGRVQGSRQWTRVHGNDSSASARSQRRLKRPHQSDFARGARDQDIHEGSLLPNTRQERPMPTPASEE